ncbi:MAG: AzlD domain-containing protein, partial [Sphaerochaetaceae bacterium]|nr:AzlD domain-containing protein [Sphaerochaetaceae bacterium]
LVLLRKGIKNKFFRSFLYYAPYVTLAVLTFPAIIYCTGNETTAIIGFIAAIITAFISESLPVTAAISCAIVFIAQLIF